jgi:hypothetical protein
MNKKRLFPLVAAIAAIGGFNQAQATPYAIAYNNIFDLAISANPALAITDYKFTSDASSTLNGNTIKNEDIGTGLRDATASQQGITLAENNMTQQGDTGVNYARSDSQIVSAALNGDPFTQAWNIAEANLVSDGSASGNTARNLSNTEFGFSLDSGGFLTFEFKADPFMQVIMPGGMIPTSEASAELSVNFSIQNQSTGATVFNWAPDGFVGVPNGSGENILGGFEADDPYSLNQTLSRLAGSDGTSTYDPTGSGGIDVGDVAPSTFATYKATTSFLAQGDYILNLAMRETVDVIRVTESLPVPGTLLVMGAGLLGFGFVRKCTHEA